MESTGIESSIDIMSQDEINTLLETTETPGDSKRQKVEEALNFKELFAMPAPEARSAYTDNLDFLTDQIRVQKQLHVLKFVRLAKSSFEDKKMRLAAEYLIFNQEKLSPASKSHADLTKQIALRLQKSKFEPGLLLLARKYKLSVKHREILMTVFIKMVEKRTVTLDQLAMLFCSSFAETVRFQSEFRKGNVLTKNDLIHLKEEHYDNSIKVVLSGNVFNLILGETILEDHYLGYGTLAEKQVEWENVILDEAEKNHVYSLIHNHGRVRDKMRKWGYGKVISYGLATTIMFQGKSGTGKTLFAHALATRLKKKVITTDINKMVGSSDFASIFRAILVQARIQDAILFLDECEKLLGNEMFRESKITDVLQAIEDFDGIIIFATNLGEDMDLAMRRRILYTVKFDIPGRDQRVAIWKSHITPQTKVRGTIDFESLAEKYEMTGGLIKNAVIMAVSASMQRNPANPVVTHEDLAEAARVQRKNNMPVLGDSNLVWYDRFDLKSLVYDATVEQQLLAMLNACTQRNRAWQDWGLDEQFDYGRGVAALFNGPSGTGKTAAAYALANELGIPVRQVNFSAMLSSWFGGTENNVREFFEKVKGKKELVLIDECDSLLTARGHEDTGRIYSNIVNLFLTELEKFDGIMVLTTNLKESLDTALERRLLFRIDFAKPDAEIRERIWRATLPAKAPFAADIDWSRIARAYEFSGGSIKNCVVNSMYLALAANAKHITLAHVESACLQEQNGFNAKKKSIGFSAA
jgi:SpoVK/Ycf46/Vps4 family AAA+-type ATPase